MKTCCDDANLLHVHKMSRMCHVCIQKWLSGQFVSLIGLIFVDSQDLVYCIVINLVAVPVYFT